MMHCFAHLEKGFIIQISKQWKIYTYIQSEELKLFVPRVRGFARIAIYKAGLEYWRLKQSGGKIPSLATPFFFS